MITYLKNGIVFSFSTPFCGDDAAVGAAAAASDGADVFMVLMVVSTEKVRWMMCP